MRNVLWFLCTRFSAEFIMSQLPAISTRSCQIQLVTLYCQCMKFSFCLTLQNIYSCHNILLSTYSLGESAYYICSMLEDKSSNSSEISSLSIHMLPLAESFTLNSECSTLELLPKLSTKKKDGKSKFILNINVPALITLIHLPQCCLWLEVTKGSDKCRVKMTLWFGTKSRELGSIYSFTNWIILIPISFNHLHL